MRPLIKNFDLTQNIIISNPGLTRKYEYHFYIIFDIIINAAENYLFVIKNMMELFLPDILYISSLQITYISSILPS